jgi:hypothetical protein
LNAKPRVTSLPVEDQPIILKALAKKSNDRFASCREMVETLLGGRRGGGAAPYSPPKPAVDDRSVTLGATHAAGLKPGPTEAAQVTNPLGPTKGVSTLGGAAAGGPTQARTASEMLQHLESVSEIVDSASSLFNATSPRMTQATSAGPIIPDMSAVGEPADGFKPPTLENLGECPPQVDAPPVTIDAAAWQPRPTLFIGVGGTGTRVLARLERRLNDRMVGAARDCFPMLVLDSDARDLMEVTHGAGVLRRAEESLALPIRKTQEYRDDSRRILEWLSRRWLYNIPRSQLTEGMRPLGRLALIDHADQAFGRIKATLVRLLKNVTASQPPPRVVVVAAISGGTGGGMVADVAFAARQILDELERPAAEVTIFMAHGTTRNPQQQELAGANAVATLTELQHFHRSSFPGDHSCKLKERPASKPAINDSYLVHLGEELTLEQYEASCDKIAEFLMLDSVTLTSAALAESRKGASGGEGMQPRTFGLCQIGFAHDQLVDVAVKRVSRGVVERWHGAPRRVDPKQSVRLVPRAGAQDAIVEGAPQELVEAKAAAIVQELHLEVDMLMQIVQAMAADEMGGQPDTFFRQFLADGAQVAHMGAIQKWIAAANEVFGRRPDDVVTKPPPAKLLLAMEDRVLRIIAQVGIALQKSIVKWVDDPVLRVHGTQRIAKAVQLHLRVLCDRLRDARARLASESQALQAALYASVPDATGKCRGQRRSPAELQTMFFQDCKLRLYELGALVAANIANALQSHSVSAHDTLVDLARELHHLAVQFATDELAEEEEVEADAGDSLAPLRQMVGEQLRQADEMITASLDEQLVASLLMPNGGLRAAISAGGAQRESLVNQLHAAARQAVLQRLGSIDIAGSALTVEGGDHPIRRCLAGAKPSMPVCGGKRRLFCILPAESAQKMTPESLAKQIGPEEFQQQPTVVPDASGDVVLLFETGGLSLKHAAAALIDSRIDLTEVASRLHTRSDVTWTPLLG